MSTPLDAATARVRAADARLSLSDQALAEHLKRLDHFAADSVRAGTGGPFGAELFVFDATAGELISLSGPQGNAVLSKGIGSAHAEAETLTADSERRALDLLTQRPDNDLRLVQVSSAESCPACRAKQIAFLHRLRDQGWPKDQRLEVVFSVTYEESALVGGFNDKPYHEDMVERDRSQLITLRELIFNDLPLAIRRAVETAGLDGSDQPFAAVSLPDPDHPKRQRIIVRGSGDPAAGHFTVEVKAMHDGASLRRAVGAATPWNLAEQGKALLVTTARAVGPLMTTDGHWSGISEIWLVQDRPPTQAESPLVDNAELMRRARLPYNHPDADLRVRVIPTGCYGLVNEAQHVWRDEVIRHDPTRLYNGLQDTA